jgi:hypothetical protein
MLLFEVWVSAVSPISKFVIVEELGPSYYKPAQHTEKRLPLQRLEQLLIHE